MLKCNLFFWSNHSKPLKSRPFNSRVHLNPRYSAARESNVLTSWYLWMTTVRQKNCNRLNTGQKGQRFECHFNPGIKLSPFFWFNIILECYSTPLGIGERLFLGMILFLSTSYSVLLVQPQNRVIYISLATYIQLI